MKLICNEISGIHIPDCGSESVSIERGELNKGPEFLNLKDRNP